MKAIKEVVGKFKGCGAYKQSVKLRSAYVKRRSGRLSRLGISTQIRVDIASHLSQRLTPDHGSRKGFRGFEQSLLKAIHSGFDVLLVFVRLYRMAPCADHF